MSLRYEPAEIEQKWRDRWADADLFKTLEEPGRPKFNGLPFFPYPSGAGLSVGHLRNYIPTDVICRAKRMQGHNVLHAMGWDAFGLPAEMEAINKKRNPRGMVKEYAETYKRQLSYVGVSYDWSREVNSSDPEFYKWTQWIFLLLFEKGLAYQGDYPANWCPKDKTVLANEEVEGGLCWRCGTPVEKKMLKQWFFKITDYAQRLIDDLEAVNWPEGIKTQQRNWIGRSDGSEFYWKIDGSDHSIKVFTTRIDTVYGSTFCVLSPEHPLVEQITTADKRAEVAAYKATASALSDQDRLATTREKTGVFIGAFAVHPFSGENTPVYVADYVLMGYGTGAIMAVPAHDTRDFEFAEKFGIQIRQVIEPADGSIEELPFVSEEGRLINSAEFSGLSCEDAQDQMTQWVEARGTGKGKVNYRLRDWLISRQRYWGAPIPIVHCDKCGVVPVPESQLPVLLPDVESYEPGHNGESPLADIADFVNTTCPSCGGDAKRETDTMGGFACSSWYFLRFCDPHNNEEAFARDKVGYWMPIDCYVGGAEHAVMHLLYARFWTKALHDMGILDFVEPFAVLKNQGMLLAPTPFRNPNENETLRVGEAGIMLSYEEAAQMPKDQVFWRWEKMSKSKGNVVTPEDAAMRYGADAIRIYELFEAPFEQTIQWTEERVQGAVRFLNRVFRLVGDHIPNYNADWRSSNGEITDDERDLRHKLHHTIAKVTDDIAEFSFNTAVASLMELTNEMSDFAKKNKGGSNALDEAIDTLILLLAPLAPHSADELWSKLGKAGFTLNEKWPQADPAMLVRNEVQIVVQVNGKLRGHILVPADMEKLELERAALDCEKVHSALEGKTIRKIIVVPGRIVNIVAN
ncbi:MAG: leucine--tRNA ligase [Fimbriimonadales bacterium]